MVDLMVGASKFLPAQQSSDGGGNRGIKHPIGY